MLYRELFMDALTDIPETRIEKKRRTCDAYFANA